MPVTITCPNHSQQLVGGLWNFFRTEHRTDLNYGSGGRLIRAHRLVLEVFMSPDKLNESSREFDDLNCLFEFLYNGEVTVSEDRLEKLLQLALDLECKVLVQAVRLVLAAKTSSPTGGVPGGEELILDMTDGTRSLSSSDTVGTLRGQASQGQTDDVLSRPGPNLKESVLHSELQNGGCQIRIDSAMGSYHHHDWGDSITSELSVPVLLNADDTRDGLVAYWTGGPESEPTTHIGGDSPTENLSTMYLNSASVEGEPSMCDYEDRIDHSMVFEEEVVELEDDTTHSVIDHRFGNQLVGVILVPTHQPWDLELRKIKCEPPDPETERWVWKPDECDLPYLAPPPAEKHRYRCYVCDMEFGRQNSFIWHVRSHRKQNADVTQLTTTNINVTTSDVSTVTAVREKISRKAAKSKSRKMQKLLSTVRPCYVRLERLPEKVSGRIKANPKHLHMKRRLPRAAKLVNGYRYQCDYCGWVFAFHCHLVKHQKTHIKRVVARTPPKGVPNLPVNSSFEDLIEIAKNSGPSKREESTPNTNCRHFAQAGGIDNMTKSPNNRVQRADVKLIRRKSRKDALTDLPKTLNTSPPNLPKTITHELSKSPKTVSNDVINSPNAMTSGFPKWTPYVTEAHSKQRVCKLRIAMKNRWDKCFDYGKTFGHSGNMNNRRRTHVKRPRGSQINPPPARFSCSLCQRTFSSDVLLQVHERSHALEGLVNLDSRPRDVHRDLNDEWDDNSKISGAQIEHFARSDHLSQIDQNSGTSPLNSPRDDEVPMSVGHSQVYTSLDHLIVTDHQGAGSILRGDDETLNNYQSLDDIHNIFDHVSCKIEVTNLPINYSVDDQIVAERATDIPSELALTIPFPADPASNFRKVDTDQSGWPIGNSPSSSDLQIHNVMAATSDQSSTATKRRNIENDHLYRKPSQPTKEIVGDCHKDVPKTKKKRVSVPPVNEKPIGCPECNRTFTKRRFLVLHTPSHSAIRPFQCPVCLQSFAYRSSLTVHVKKHQLSTNPVASSANSSDDVTQIVRDESLTYGMHDALTQTTKRQNDQLRSVSACHRPAGQASPPSTEEDRLDFVDPCPGSFLDLLGSSKCQEVDTDCSCPFLKNSN